MTRLYIWTFETALIEECGYKGAQPYWDWVSRFSLPLTVTSLLLTNLNTTDSLYRPKQAQIR